MISLVISLLLQSSFDHCQRASGSFANLRVVHHGIDVVRYPLLLVRTALEMEAGLLDSQVQEVLGAEEVTGRGLASGPAASMGCSGRDPECKAIRARLLRDSSYSGGWHVRRSFRSGRWASLGHAGRGASHKLHIIRIVA